ncbi:hypothetical protein N7466_008969 [Penicillium verhagenii]|uniref:uncharacterized protein n=1 Tax=Penicillium verhagenii TaxID=1562060 RepID=UPI002545595C|nr:uncharacterized protein N7466_008969 [Penicillium verhagenii]KAJ5924782.1 hypothetical protein N7466_008969 [Penicillium verhagenii]
MHFANAAALLAFSSISVTYAAPFANPQDELSRRQTSYEVVNVDGDSNGSAAPEIETVTETAKSTVTAAGAPAVLQTITVTATPTPAPSSLAPSSSAPASHLAPPPGGSFMPANSNGFFRRGLNAAGNPVQFAQNYISSSGSSWPTVPTSLAVRDAAGWYPSPSFTPSAAPSSSSLVARQFGGWGPSDSTPVSPSTTPTASPSLVARQFGGWGPSSSLPVPPSSAATPSASLVARQFGGWGSSSVPTPSATPSATPSVSPSAYVYARGYDAASWGIPSASPSSLVARQFGGWSPSSVPTPSGPASSVSTPVAPTSFLVKRDFESHFTPSSAPTPTPSASLSIPLSSALLY